MRTLGRGLLSTLLAAALRANAIALLALLASDVASERARFHAVWALLLLGPCIAVSLIELPTRLAFGGDERPSRRADALVTLITGLVLGALGAHLVPVLRALGMASSIAAAAGGGALAAALIPVRGSARLRRRRAGVVVGTALFLGIVFWWDPDARYARRYEEAATRQAEVTAGASAEQNVMAVSAPGSDLELARAVAEGYLALQRPETLRWSWEEAVACYGLVAYARASGDERPLDLVRAWIDFHRTEALEGILWADHSAPAILVAALAGTRESAGDPELTGRVVRYLREEAPRTTRGTVSHVGLLAGGLLPPQAWVDTLFMHGVMLIELARPDAPTDPADKRWALDEATRLALSMAAELQDPDDGLFRHASIELPLPGPPRALVLPVERCYWARGNAWALFVLTELQRARSALGEAPDGRVEALRIRLRDAVVEHQDEGSGLWRTDLTGSPERNPRETSASALIVAALRRDPSARGDARLERAIAHGLEGLRSRIRVVGSMAFVDGTSTGTHPGFRAYYRSLPLRASVGHGVGAVLLALTSG